MVNLKDFISEFVSFREQTLTKRIKFDLDKALSKAHLLLGAIQFIQKVNSIL